MSVVNLEQINSKQTGIAGGKGANLGELIEAGFPVPPGFVVSADAYSRFIETLELPANDELPEDTTTLISQIRQQIIEANLPADLVAEMQTHHQALASQRTADVIYAVRSSATAEDLADASFAGQHDTYYYVTADNIPLMVKKCWASLWSEQAFSYRQSQNIEHRSVNMAVIVQEMVRSDVSGVTFTADPVSGSQTVIITESSWGMGAAIVDGRVSPDQYVVDKVSNRLTSIRVSDKKFMVPAILDPDKPSRLQEVPAHLRRAETLTDEQIEKIAALAIKAELHFGKPQDLEWALQDGEVFMLQSRPITIMGEADPDLPSGKYILFKPVAENFTDPLKPLTQDLFEDMIPMMKVIQGRVYIDFRIIRALIPLKLNEQDIARLAYLSEPQDKRMRLSLPRLVLVSVFVFINYLMMAVFNRRTANMPDDFMHGFRRYFRQVAEDDTISPAHTLIHLFTRYRFFEPAGNMVLLINLVAPRYILMLSVLSSMLKRWAADLPEDTASLLCSGNDGVLSTDMGRSILNLSRIARGTPSLTSLIRDTSPANVLNEISTHPDYQPFKQALAAFLDMHGHRALKEFELSSVRWEEDPAQVIGMVRNYLLLETELDTAESGVKAQREDLRAQVRKRVGKARYWIIDRLVRDAKYYIKLRENSRFYHIMGFYAVRKKILRIEQDLLTRGVMKCKDDIFYLQWQEVQDLRDGRLGWSDVEETIRSRRMEHIRLTKLTPPKTIGIELDDLDEMLTGNILSGQGASPGRYEGIARVIMDPATDSEIEPGEILVAPYTDPAWTPLFLTANAAVVEVGSYLSHAGTIAREYGMPCVVDVTNCTSRITTGTRIIVDGSNGAVQILDTEEAQ